MNGMRLKERVEEEEAKPAAAALGSTHAICTGQLLWVPLSWYVALLWHEIMGFCVVLFCVAVTE